MLNHAAHPEASRGAAATTAAELGKLYIIVINWRLAAETIECVHSLRDAGAQPGQVIVVDNGSGDDSAAQLEAALGDFIELIVSPRNLGFAGGNNLAIQRALDHGADSVLLINNDTVVAPTIFAELANCAAAHPNWMLLAPLILYHNDFLPNSDPKREIIWSLGDRLIPGTLLTRGLLRNRPLPADLPPCVEVDFLNACGLLIRREVFDEIGLLDARFFMYAEDVDFCWRARRAGLRMGCATSARMWHKVSRSTGVYHPTARYWRVSNQIRVYRRYAHAWQWPLMLGFTWLRCLGLVLRDLRAGRVETALRTVQAWIHGWFGQTAGKEMDGNGSV